ncbi:DUF4148 domain-containing protein [Delftia acidovorans]|uniref:DUF4148 domain-containing protein n=1 Tax=Delftia acidovorans TaxID=80866 RepID=UPI0028ED6963|nr:DUF4148 domain-containing protein [Delftia acidovorans]
MTHRRISLSSMLAIFAAVITLGLPGLASAEYWHPANNEAGVIVHPYHFKSTKTRAQVRAEVEAAMREGRLSFGEGNYPPPIVFTGPGKTRAEVRAEVEAALREGRLSYGESNYPPPIVNTGPGKTRQEVINELINEPPEEREARLRLYGGG